jgi:hypothetical protein
VKTPGRRRKSGKIFTQAVAWITLAIFLLTSVGVVLMIRQ